MRECKIIHLCYTNAIRNAERRLKEDGVRGAVIGVSDHPAAEEEINFFLAQGYRIVSAFQNDGMWFVLERDQQSQRY